MKICVVDGQGGGIGKLFIEKLKVQLPDDAKIMALGTNSAATVSMIKAGASCGATGENAIVYNVNDAHIIAGPIGIISANSMMGELTPAIAHAVSISKAAKFLIPVSKCNIFIAEVNELSLPELIDKTVKAVVGYINDK